jgi:hypothetical protein
VSELSLLVVSARLTRPLPLTREVTSTSVQAPALSAPDEPAEAPIAGALAKVIALSPQLVLETAETL